MLWIRHCFDKLFMNWSVLFHTIMANSEGWTDLLTGWWSDWSTHLVIWDSGLWFLSFSGVDGVTSFSLELPLLFEMAKHCTNWTMSYGNCPPLHGSNDLVQHNKGSRFPVQDLTQPQLLLFISLPVRSLNYFWTLNLVHKTQLQINNCKIIPGLHPLGLPYLSWNSRSGKTTYILSLFQNSSHCSCSILFLKVSKIWTSCFTCRTCTHWQHASLWNSSLKTAGLSLNMGSP